MVEKVTAAHMWLPPTKITDLNFAAPYEDITISKPTIQESLLFSSVKTKLGLLLKQ